MSKKNFRFQEVAVVKNAILACGFMLTNFPHLLSLLVILVMDKPCMFDILQKIAGLHLSLILVNY